jgi:hypothetical protein
MKYKDIPPYGLRLQPDLKEKLDAIVREKKKKTPDWSLNSEIAKRLEESLQVRNDLAQFSDGEMIDELIRRWGRDLVCIQLGKKQQEEPPENQ